MRALPMLALWLALGATRASGDTCVECHRQLGAPLDAPVERLQDDVHSRARLSCDDCHGGDPTDADLTSMDAAKGFVGRPSAAQIPAFCGRCHADEDYMRRFNPAMATDQLAQYRTSIHGRRLAAGDTRVATCVSCHGAHGILPVGDARSPVHPLNVATTCGRCHANAPYMAAYGIPVDQVARYRQSVHGHRLLVERDLSAPTCNDCHGNHGAFPPGADSVAAVCGQCHPVNRDLFLASPHKAAFARLGLPECVTCHGNHGITRATDDMLGTGDASVCVACHSPDSGGYAAGGRMQAALERLRAAIEQAETATAQASAAGMEMAESEFALRSVHETLVQARNAVHAFDPDTLEKAAEGGRKAADAIDAGAQAALAESRSRRWMATIPLAAIALVVGLLCWKIRELDAETPRR